MKNTNEVSTWSRDTQSGYIQADRLFVKNADMRDLKAIKALLDISSSMDTGLKGWFYRNI